MPFETKLSLPERIARTKEQLDKSAKNLQRQRMKVEKLKKRLERLETYRSEVEAEARAQQ